MTSMTLEQTQKNFPLDLSHLHNILDPQEYNRELHESIRGQLKRGGLVSPTHNVTNFQLEPDDTPNFIENIMNKVMSANPDAHDSEDDRQTYLQRRFEFIGEGHEGWREKVYRDSRKLRTVGYGFNLEEPSNRELYKRALGKTDQDFDNLRDGNTALSLREGRILFEASAGAAERLISSKFSDIDLKGYERLALVSLAYNHPNLIGPNLTKYVREGNKEAVIDEITNRSNLHKIKGIQNRRVAEAEMFSGGHKDESGEWSIASLFGISTAEAADAQSSDDLIERGRSIKDDDDDTPKGPTAPRPRVKPDDLGVQQTTEQEMTPEERMEKHAGGSQLASVVPANIRAFASDLLGFDLESVRTEDYFSDGEKNAIRAVVTKAMKRTGRKSGGVKYDDYTTKQSDVSFAGSIRDFVFNQIAGNDEDNAIAQEYIVKTTLGRFSFRIDKRGHLIVEDEFDFNDAEKLQKQNPTFRDKVSNWLEYSSRDDVGMYGVARRMGALWGSKANEGAKFEIDLGPLAVI